MKIAVMNYSGSVGKTIISSYLLYPRMAGAKFFAIETINMSAADLGVDEVMSLTGDNFGQLIEEIVFEDNAIVDIGASNVERFLSTMTKYEGAIDEFDKYLIPVTPDDKAWQESIKTALALSVAGVPKSKIILLPNRIKSTPQEDIASVYEWAKDSKKPLFIKMPPFLKVKFMNTSRITKFRLKNCWLKIQKHLKRKLNPALMPTNARRLRDVIAG